MDTHNKNSLFCLSLIVILGFSVYANSLNGQFVLDDNYLLKNNVIIKNGAHFPSLFMLDIGAGTDKSSNFYRPMQMISYMIDYANWDLKVVGYHLTNVFLHIAAGLVLFWFISLLFKDHLLALLTSLLFVIHPVHTEAVAYISGRADSLVAVFMLLTFIFYIKKHQTQKIVTYFLMVGSYGLALLSKESALILPLLVLLYNYCFKVKLQKKAFFSLLGLAVVYGIFRLNFFTTSPGSITTTFPERLPGFFIAFFNYIRLLFLPFDLHMEYGNPVFTFSNPKALIGIVLFLSFLRLLYTKRKHTLLSFSLSWYVITLLPNANLYPINAFMAEHWLYIPSIGFVLILAKGLSVLYNKSSYRYLSVVLMLGVLTFFSIMTIQQNRYWRDPVTFYEWTLKYNPKSVKSYNNLAMEYKDRGRINEAIAYYQKSLELDPSLPDAYNNLGIIYGSQGQIKKAIPLFEKVLELKPRFADAHNNLGNCYKALGETEKAVRFYKKAIEYNPLYYNAYNNLGNMYNTSGRKDEAIQYYKKAIQINPNYAQPYNNLGMTYLDLGRYIEALDSFNKAIQNDPFYVKAYYNRADTLNRLGRKSEAAASLRRAQELDSTLIK